MEAAGLHVRAAHTTRRTRARGGRAADPAAAPLEAALAASERARAASACGGAERRARASGALARSLALARAATMAPRASAPARPSPHQQLQGDAMEDEYGALDTSGETWSPADLALECGRTLARPRVRYRTYGALDGARGNCVVVCHALTGNADVGSWWGELVGPGRPVDTGEYFVVCANALGGCYGTCGPTSEDPGSRCVA